MWVVHIVQSEISIAVPIIGIPVKLYGIMVLYDGFIHNINVCVNVWMQDWDQ